MNKLKENVFYEMPTDWVPYVEKLLEDIEKYCIKNEITLPHILQIKEKYNTLRFYFSIDEDWSDDNLRRINLMIDITEKMIISKGEINV